MDRRKPGKNNLVTTRIEEDKPIIKSGANKRGVLTGDTLKFIIKNTNSKSNDYNSLLRPGHAD
jgi:chorismate synthase